MPPKSLSDAIAHSFQNRTEIEGSDICACFNCFAHFVPNEIRLWSDSIDPNDDDPGALRADTDQFKGSTAICPYCKYDSVIGSASGCNLCDDFLRQLRNHWYGTKDG